MPPSESDLTGNPLSEDDKPSGISDASPRQRKIIHVDMDAFYASVEQRDNPDLRGKPVAVGGSRERGVVAAANYEARNFGVRSEMPSVTAKRQCPDLIFVKPRFEVYKVVSQQIREIFEEHTPIIEPLSLDEAYLDVTENLQNILLARDVALAIRAKIKDVTGLNASAGISYNKFLAKLASDHRNTFSSDLVEFEPMVAELQPLIDKVWRHCEDKGSRGRTVTLKVKFNDFETITRSRSVPVPVSSRDDLERLSVVLLQNEMPLPKPVHLLGVSLSSLQGDDEYAQLGFPI